MDLKALQTTLREFAAERDWQPFHTPKNLAMALMVEAAELAEIFQWMTPEQSQAARSDPVLQEQVADEVADVLLYLLQIADHTGIDLKRAVGRKLVKNSKKHTPVRSGLPLGTAACGGIETHVLVDWENVQPKDDDIRSLVPDVTDLWLFQGPNQKGVDAKHASFGDKATPVRIARTGKNALDFHTFYMGYIAARHPDARFVVVSNDKGYAPMLEHAAELGFAARQAGFGNGSVVVATAASKSRPVKKSAPVRNAAAKKVPPKPAARKAGVSKPSTAVAKAPTKKVPAAKKIAATKTAASPVAKFTVASPAAASSASSTVDGNSAIDLNKAVSHVVASLGKMASKPAKHSKLVAAIKSLLGPSADDWAVHSVLMRLLASGKVRIDSDDAVRYEPKAD